jgi:hypothetical protein
MGRRQYLVEAALKMASVRNYFKLKLLSLKLFAQRPCVASAGRSLRAGMELKY